MRDDVKGLGVPEFPIRYGFTGDVAEFGSGSLEFSGTIKVTPRALGIYRTGDAYGFILKLLRGIVAFRFGWWAADRMERPADVALHTDGAPEHVIDSRRMTLLYDEKRHFIIVQVPGTTHFVLRARRRGAMSAAVAETQLLEALERYGHTEAKLVQCRGNYFALVPAVVLALAVLFFIVIFLARIFWR